MVPTVFRKILIRGFEGSKFDVTILEAQEKALNMKAAKRRASLDGEKIDLAIHNHRVG